MVKTQKIPESFALDLYGRFDTLVAPPNLDLTNAADNLRYR